MQYVGRAIGSVSKTWSSINPATLSGAIDVVVVEHLDGRLACSPFHVRFGKFQILKPSQKKVLVSVNGQPTNIPMKLGDSGEAYFVFETEADVGAIPEELFSSPVVSAASSPSTSPNDKLNSESSLEEPDYLDIGKPAQSAQQEIPMPSTPPPPRRASIFEQRAKRLNEKLHAKQIPSKFDNNGDLLLDIEGYKPSKDKVHDTDEILKQLLQDELGTEFDISAFVKEDRNGNMRIINPGEPSHLHSPLGSPHVLATEDLDGTSSGISESSTQTDLTTTTEYNSLASSNNVNSAAPEKNYIKTIRLTSEQLKCLELKYGENDLSFSVDNSRAVVTAKLFLWRWDVPLVISDIDGTITKSDALGHVLTMIGRDWTHLGVAQLFTEIRRNGYNVVYLTARSAGQADSTRSYLRSIVQDGFKLPRGPVILSPDRTMAALRREVILKKPEVFKIACLNDLRNLYFGEHDFGGTADEEKKDELPTPFVAGFGNRITDALAYRTVGIPSSRIFTINPDGEVHMELLELAGYRSSYIHINELVDHFFPPVGLNYTNCADDYRSLSPTPGSPVATVEERSLHRPHDVKFTDVNFWRDPIPSLEDLSDISTLASDDDTQGLLEPESKARLREGINLNPPTTPRKSDHTHAARRSSTSHDIGQQMYLDLGSPLASPKLKHVDPTAIENHMKSFSISNPGKPSTQTSNLSVLNNGVSHENVHPVYNPPDSADDEFDEDEFDQESNASDIHELRSVIDQNDGSENEHEQEEDDEEEHDSVNDNDNEDEHYDNNDEFDEDEFDI